MNGLEAFHHWLTSPYIDEETRAELYGIEHQPKEIEERFYKQLEFGTGGLRGVLGAGTNRINRYTIRRVTQGLANYIATFSAGGKRGVVIAHDSRHQSPELALETACTLAANGIAVYLFESLRPTPELSFAVRELGAQAGIVLTASHNPPEYNGYKVYWEDGGQVVPALAEKLIGSIEQVRDFGDIRTLPPEMAEQTGHLHWIGKDVDVRYIDKLKQLCLNPEMIRQVASTLRIVYTPLHGAGNEMVQRILREVGFTEVEVVPEQEQPDPNFSTVKSPNPEEREAFNLAIPLAQKVGADLVVGTDPDCDRVGVVVRNTAGEYEVLTGNQTGALLLHYLCSEHEKRGTLPPGATMIKTIVTSEMGRPIAARFGVETIETLTGFKYIGEQIALFEKTGERSFLFGYEESYGYLAGTFVRDKDAVMATMLIAEMAAFYKTKGMSLYDALQELYREFGYYREALVSRTLKGIDGLAQIQRIMESWRSHPPTEIGERFVVERRDYLTGIVERNVDGKAFEPSNQQQNVPGTQHGKLSMQLDLPSENVLYYKLDDESWFCLRPSGTEPKIKIYFSVKADTALEADTKLEQLQNLVMARIDGSLSKLA